MQAKDGPVLSNNQRNIQVSLTSALPKGISPQAICAPSFSVPGQVPGFWLGLFACSGVPEDGCCACRCCNSQQDANFHPKERAFPPLVSPPLPVKPPPLPVTRMFPEHRHLQLGPVLVEHRGQPSTLPTAAPIWVTAVPRWWPPTRLAVYLPGRCWIG